LLRKKTHHFQGYATGQACASLGQDDFSIGLHTFELGAAFALASDLEDDFLPTVLDEKIRSLPANSCKSRRWSDNCILVNNWPK
jgi:hypothetical protein